MLSNLISCKIEFVRKSCNTKYYFKVVAIDDQGGSTSGQVWSFNTQNRPTYTVYVNTTDLSPALSTNVSIDGINHGSIQRGESETLIFNSGTTHQISVDTPINNGTGVQYAAINSPQSVSDNQALIFDYDTQYYLTISTEPLGLTSQLSGGSWLYSGISINLVAPSTFTNGSIDYVFSKWIIDDIPVSGNPISVTMNAPHVANAVFITSTPIYGVPSITGFAPLSPVTDVSMATRIFNISVNQTVNISWYVNGTRVQFNESVYEARYTKTSAALGTWNVTASAQNGNGTAMQEWVWIVSPGAEGWQYYRDISISNTGAALNDYQVLVNLTGVDFPMEANISGDDIRFKGAGGSELAYWIERWDFVNKSGKVWVNVTSVPTGVSIMHMWYGNSNASRSSNETLTFPIFEDFEDGDYTNIYNWTGDTEYFTIQDAAKSGIYSVRGGNFNIQTDEKYLAVNFSDTGEDLILESYFRMGSGLQWTWGIKYLNSSDGIIVGIEKLEAGTGGGGLYWWGINGMQSIGIGPNNPYPFTYDIWQRLKIELNRQTGKANYTIYNADDTTIAWSAKDLNVSINNIHKIKIYGYRNSIFHGGDRWFYADYIRVRKYASPEPSVSMELIDTTPPSTVTNLINITYAQTYLNWTWTDPTDPDFDKVMIYMNGTFQINVTNGTQYFNATNLTPDTLYEISTRTVDTSGNINQTWINHSTMTAPRTQTLMLNNKSDLETECIFDSLIKTYTCNSNNIYITGTVLVGSGENVKLIAQSGFVITPIGNLTSAASYGQYGGNLSIIAPNVTIDGILLSSGGVCTGNRAYDCIEGGGGNISVLASTVNISGEVSSKGNDGYCDYYPCTIKGGDAGKIDIQASDTIDIDGTVLANGGTTQGCDNFAGNGGVLNLSAENINIGGRLSSKGGNSTITVSWCGGGSAGSSGAINISTNILALNGDVFLNGGTSFNLASGGNNYNNLSRNGGTLEIDAEDTVITGAIIDATGGDAIATIDYYWDPSWDYGGLGGNISIRSDNLSMGINSFNTYGGTAYGRRQGSIRYPPDGYEYGGDGGNIYIETFSNLAPAGTYFAYGGKAYTRDGTAVDGKNGTIIIKASSLDKSGATFIPEPLIPLSNSGGGSWSYNMSIIISNPGAVLTDYQVPVNLTGTRFPNNANSSGDDIRFTDAGGAELSYWIENWNYSDLSALVWVNITNIPSGNSTIKMW